MKIFVFSTCILYLKSISGGDVVLPQIVRKWPEGKYDLHVITSKEGQAVWEGLGAKAVFHLLPETILDRSDSVLLGPVKYFVRTLQSIEFVSRVIAKEKGNFLIYTAPEFVPDALPALIARMRLKQSRWLAWCYHVILPPWKRKGNFWFNLFSYLIQRGGLKMMKWKADLVLVLGGTYKDLVGEGFKKEKLQVMNAGVDKKLLQSAVPVEEKYGGISIGTLTYTRGVYDLLEIWKLVVSKKPETKLAIVGGGSEGLVRDYKERIRKMGLSQNVRYYGFVPKNEDVYSILKSSKLYICPLHENGWSLPVAEAMTVGVPTAAYDLKMFHYAFKKGFVMVPMYAKQALADKIVELLNDEEKREELSQEALEESKNFDWQNIADSVSKTIKWVVG